MLRRWSSLRARQMLASVSPAAWTHLTVSIVLIVVLFLDARMHRPSGIIKLSWFLGRPVSHGLDPCAWDYEGSWQVGTASGADPTQLRLHARAAVTCATVNTTSVSFVADPFLFIPSLGGSRSTIHSSQHAQSTWHRHLADELMSTVHLVSLCKCVTMYTSGPE